jgi:phage tail sheath gpL-like
MGSTAVSNNAVAAVTGILLDKGYFNVSSPNLPAHIATIAEANHNNQAALTAAGSFNKLQLITSAKQAATLYGYGSPLHIAINELIPPSGGGVPVNVYAIPIIEAAEADASVKIITVSGTCTTSGQHTLRICGNRATGGSNYNFTVTKGDTHLQICNKITAAINGVLSSEVTAQQDSPDVICTSKWKGATANGITIEIDLNNTSTGITYSVSNLQSGSGISDITDGLASIGNKWIPVIINGFGLDTDTMDALELWNGVPDPELPTGRYDPLVFKPGIAFTGTVEDDITMITDARSTQCTIASAIAPLSLGLPIRVAAAYAKAFATKATNDPKLDIIGTNLTTIPLPSAGDVPSMEDYNIRNNAVQMGSSTAIIVADKFQVQDFVTTYHPEGENPPFYRYPRDLFVAFNIKFGYALLVERLLIGKVLAADNSPIQGDNIMRPKDWKGVVLDYLEDCEKRGLITNLENTKQSVQVSINSTNPNRLDTVWEDQITGICRISATTIKQGFYFGN